MLIGQQEKVVERGHNTPTGKMEDPLETPVRNIGRRLSSIPDAELNAILPDSPTVGICERYFKCNGERLSELMSMCLGLKSGDRELGDALVEPYASMKFRKKVTPTQKHMVEEIKRRTRVTKADSPACTYWTRERLTIWLQANDLSERAACKRYSAKQ
jgi:hypothetical protein